MSDSLQPASAIRAEPARRRSRRLGAKLLLLAVAAMAPLLACEAFLWVFDPGGFAEIEDREAFSRRALAVVDFRGYPVLRLVPGVTSYLGHEVRISEQRLRNDVVVVPKPADVFRIVVVGDSVPFGWGVAESDPFPRVLETMLQQRTRRDGKRYEVVNGGSPGWGFPEELVWLVAEGMPFAPDLVLHCIVNNDIAGTGDGPVLFLSETLRRVRTLRLIERTADVLLRDPDVAVPDAPPEAIIVALDHFHEVLAPANVPYVLFDTAGIPASAVEHATKIGARYCDTVVTDDWANAYRVARSDTHPNAAGHRVLAERALAAIEPLLER